MLYDLVILPAEDEVAHALVIVPSRSPARWNVALLNQLVSEPIVQLHGLAFLIVEEMDWLLVFVLYSAFVRWRSVMQQQTPNIALLILGVVTNASTEHQSRVRLGVEETACI